MATVERALDRDYHFRGDFYEASDTPQEVPEALAERDQQLSEESGEASVPSPVDVSSGLPGAIPSAARSNLKDAGIETWEELLEANDVLDTFEEIEGIGPTRAENIVAAIEQVREFHESDEE
jgi:DNA polymerase/3'-5' exonuclease PolX